MDEHKQYMKRAFELAKHGWGRTNPNPLVGAIIVKNDKIIGEGFHEFIGGAHAEVNAIRNAKTDVSGGTIYVSLEPCSHFGRTPPCIQAIINAGLKEVVIAMEDPNPKCNGNGIGILRKAGITVVENVLEKKEKKINEIFIKYITQKKPFVIMKSAMTLDGKIATSKGNSKWVTGESARNNVHLMRDRVSAIMVGINTVLADDPMLTTRRDGVDCGEAVKIIVDSTGKLPLSSRLLSTGKTILATTSEIDQNKEKQLIEKGVIILKCEGENGSVNLNTLMDKLYELEIDSVLIEGGGTLNWSAIESGIVDKVMCYIAPKIIGGKNALTPVEGSGIQVMNDAINLTDIEVQRFGDDILIEGYIAK